MSEVERSSLNAIADDIVNALIAAEEGVMKLSIASDEDLNSIKKVWFEKLHDLVDVAIAKYILDTAEPIVVDNIEDIFDDWNNAKNQPPEESGRYLVFIQNSEDLTWYHRTGAYYSTKAKQWKEDVDLCLDIEGFSVTYWMELPKKPRSYGS